MFPGPVSGDGQQSGSPPAVPFVLVQRYELGPLLGQGGSAQVHRAWDRLLNRTVAVKLFTSGVAGPDRCRQYHELAVLTRLNHPGLVELYDTGVDHGRAYLVMRLVQGPSLADRFRDVPLPVATVAEWGAQLADTLAYVHSRGVTHRDIKPANVLLNEQDRPLLADFGIALLADITRVTVSGAVLGTAAYMAPEQVRGEMVGPPADVYALGLVMLEALTGRREYPGTGVESACARLHRAPAVPENLPVGLAHTLHRMTALEPTERPSAAAAASVLQAAAAEFHGDPTVVFTDRLTMLLGEATQPAGLSDRRRRWVVLAGAVSGVALAASLLGLTAIAPTSGGATGIVSSPSAAAVIPQQAVDPPRSAAPSAAVVIPQQAVDPPRSAAPSAAVVIPQQAVDPPRSAAPPAAAVIPLQAVHPPRSAASPAISPQAADPPLTAGTMTAVPPAVATEEPAPQVQPAVPTQAIPPPTAHSESGGSHTPHSDMPSGHGSGIPGSFSNGIPDEQSGGSSRDVDGSFAGGGHG